LRLIIIIAIEDDAVLAFVLKIAVSHTVAEFLLLELITRVIVEDYLINFVNLHGFISALLLDDLGDVRINDQVIGLLFADRTLPSPEMVLEVHVHEVLKAEDLEMRAVAAASWGLDEFQIIDILQSYDDLVHHDPLLHPEAVVNKIHAPIP